MDLHDPAVAATLDLTHSREPIRVHAPLDVAATVKTQNVKVEANEEPRSIYYFPLPALIVEPAALVSSRVSRADNVKHAGQYKPFRCRWHSDHRSYDADKISSPQSVLGGIDSDIACACHKNDKGCRFSTTSQKLLDSHYKLFHNADHAQIILMRARVHVPALSAVVRGEKPRISPLYVTPIHPRPRHTLSNTRRCLVRTSLIVANPMVSGLSSGVPSSARLLSVCLRGFHQGTPSTSTNVLDATTAIDTLCETNDRAPVLPTPCVALPTSFLQPSSPCFSRARRLLLNSSSIIRPDCSTLSNFIPSKSSLSPPTSSPMAHPLLPFNTSSSDSVIQHLCYSDHSNPDPEIVEVEASVDTENMICQSEGSQSSQLTTIMSSNRSVYSPSSRVCSISEPKVSMCAVQFKTMKADDGMYDVFEEGISDLVPLLGSSSASSNPLTVTAFTSATTTIDDRTHVMCPWPKCRHVAESLAILHVHYRQHTKKQILVCSYHGCVHLAVYPSSLSRYPVWFCN